MAEANICCDFCAFLKIQKFPPLSNVRVEIEVNSGSHIENSPREIRRIANQLARNRNSEKKLRKIMKELIILLGHGTFASSIPDAVAKLMKRNYPDLIEWNGNSKLVIFIPEFYLNKAVRHIDPSKGKAKLQHCEEVIESNTERKEDFEKQRNIFLGGMRTWRGEAPELDVYNALKKRFETTDENVAVFHSLDLMKFDPERQDNNINEKDFIVVSATHKYIMAIEVKKTLNKREAEKSHLQLRGTVEDLR